MGKIKSGWKGKLPDGFWGLLVWGIGRWEAVVLGMVTRSQP
jgi:hypothetical protein